MVRLFGFGFLVLGLAAFLLWGMLTPRVIAADCGQPPLPPCAGQGVGETSSPTSSTTSQSATTSTSSTSSSSSTCGQPPLPPCQGQGVGETTSPTTQATTSSSAKTPSTTSTTASSPSSSSACGQPPLSPCAGQGIGETSTSQPSASNAPPVGSSNRTQAQSGFLDNFLGTSVITNGTQTLQVEDILVWILYSLSLLAVLLGVYFFTKRRRLWGVIYDARTKEPVEMAVVRLFDQEHHKLLETRVTPRSGRYSFLAEPGEYYLEVTKEGYHFPSRIVTSKTDNEYINLYRGEVVKLGVGQSLVAPDIAIDSEAGEIKRASLFRRVLFPFLDTVRLPILLLAVLLAILFQLGGDSARQPLLSVTLLPLEIALVLLLFIEFFLIRRGRK